MLTLYGVAALTFMMHVYARQQRAKRDHRASFDRLVRQPCELRGVGFAAQDAELVPKRIGADGTERRSSRALHRLGLPRGRRAVPRSRSAAATALRLEAESSGVGISDRP